MVDNPANGGEKEKAQRRESMSSGHVEMFGELFEAGAKGDSGTVEQQLGGIVKWFL